MKHIEAKLDSNYTLHSPNMKNMTVLEFFMWFTFSPVKNSHIFSQISSSALDVTSTVTNLSVF